MRMISWNVNGFRAVVKKGFYEAFAMLDADIFALQETKIQAHQVELELPPDYYDYWSYAVKKGYSGTAVFTKEEPIRIIEKIGLTPQDSPILGLKDIDVVEDEGRICALEYPTFYFVDCYTPNAQDALTRLDLRMAWDLAFTRFVSGLDKDKPVIICGDLNVAHQEIDLKNYKTNRGHAGFTDEERADFTSLLDAGFTDTFRHLYPDVTGAYSWWSFRGNARANNTGWRIDYFLVSNRLASSIEAASIYPEVFGSDHCPVGLELNTSFV